MVRTAGHTATQWRGRWAAIAGIGTRPGGRRHPLVAVAMVLPLALVLALASGALETVAAQASSVAGMLKH